MTSMTTLIKKSVLLLAFLTPCLSVAAVDPAADLSDTAEELMLAAESGESSNELQQRLETLERRAREVPEDPMASMGDASFPGAWRLPGTDAAIRIGGFAKMNIVSSFDPLVTRDRFIVGSIPPEGEVVEGAAAEVVLTARQSRVNLDLRDQTEIGSVRAFVEGDFAGEGNTFRLRHAFGQFLACLPVRPGPR